MHLFHDVTLFFLLMQKISAARFIWPNIVTILALQAHDNFEFLKTKTKKNEFERDIYETSRIYFMWHDKLINRGQSLNWFTE